MYRLSCFAERHATEPLSDLFLPKALKFYKEECYTTGTMIGPPASSPVPGSI